MTIQGLDRRSVLEMLAKAASASQFPGFSRWAYGAEHKHGKARFRHRSSHTRHSISAGISTRPLRF